MPHLDSAIIAQCTSARKHLLCLAGDRKANAGIHRRERRFLHWPPAKPGASRPASQLVPLRSKTLRVWCPWVRIRSITRKTDSPLRAVCLFSGAPAGIRTPAKPGASRPASQLVPLRSKTLRVLVSVGSNLLYSRKSRQTALCGLSASGAPAGIRTPDTLLKRQD